MIEKLAENVALLFLKKDIIEKEDLEIYIYGSELLISEIIGTLLILGIGVVFEKFFKTILYLFVFTIIRVYAGGYHAPSHRTCITSFSLLFVGVLIITEWIFKRKVDILLVIGTIVSVGIIFLFAPVEDHHKPLDRYEVNEFKRKARMRSLLLSVFVVLMYIIFPEFQDEALYGMVAICQIAFFLIVGYAKNKLSDQEVAL